MAVKYVRDGYRNRPDGRRGLFGTSTPPGTQVRRRLVVVYLGIAMFAVLLLAYQFAGLGTSLRWLPIREGGAVVLDKIVAETDGMPARYFLDLEVTVPADVLPSADTHTFVDRVPITDASWEMVDIGTRVDVTYQVAADGSKLVVRGIRLRSRPDPARHPIVFEPLPNTPGPADPPGGLIAPFAPIH